MFHIRPSLRQYAVVIVVNLMILCLGIDLSWTSPMLVKLRDPTQSPLSHPITESEGGWIVSIGYLCCIFTLPFISLLADYIGRKYCLLAASLTKIIANVMTIFATEVWMLLMARAINVIMNTANTLTIMVYSTEIASKEIRGTLSSFIAILIGFGSLLMLGVGPYISYLNLTVLVTSVNVCACIPLFFIPDTPYSLYNKGKIEEAKKVLIFFRGSEILAEEEMIELSRQTPNQKLDTKELFKNKIYLKALTIVIIMGTGVQCLGFYFILFYLQTIMEITNTSVSPALSSLIIGLIQILASICVGAVTDRFGRRPIIISSILGMSVGMIGLGIFFALKQHGTIISGFLNYLPLLSIAFITCCFSGGVGSQYFVIISELLDDRIRAIGTSASLVGSCFIIFLIARFTFPMLSILGSAGSFLIFGIICIIMSIFVYFYIPETKQKTIAEIQMALAGLDDGSRKHFVSRL